MSARHKMALKEYEEILHYGDRNPEVLPGTYVLSCRSLLNDDGWSLGFLSMLVK